MCGIVGLIARRPVGFNHSDMDVMENMLVLDTLRGLDSTGVYAIDRNKNIGIMKVASHPYHLFACDDWSKFRGKVIQSGRIIIGHNRKATQGSINSSNAHPFHENNIVLVHNGTLRGDHKKIADKEVDSHAVCHAFNEKGAEAVIPTIDGAFAFVWWDIAASKLYAIRNEERPLSLVVTDHMMALASEPWMAHATLTRAHNKITETIDLEPGMLYEFDLDGKYTTKKIELKKAPTTTYYTTSTPAGDACGKKTSGALTLIKTTMNTTSESSAVTDTAESAPVVDKEVGPNPDQFPSNPLFPKGERVLLKINEWVLVNDAKSYKISGKVVQPDLPEIDFVHHITVGQAGIKNMPSMMPVWMDGHVTGVILAYTSSLCGGSIFVKDLELEEEVKIHMTDIPKSVWDHVVTHCKCKDCKAPIYDLEAPFTSVSKKPDGLRVICADCVEDKLVGDMKNEFQQRRNDALQDDLTISPESGNVIVVPPKGASSQTLH